MIKWMEVGKSWCYVIGDKTLWVYYNEGCWEADCGKYIDHHVLMADNLEDAQQEALSDLLCIAADKVVEEAGFVQSITGAGL